LFCTPKLEQIVFKEESYRIVGACFEVYKEKGSGFLEAVYQERLAIELDDQKIPFSEKPRLRLDSDFLTSAEIENWVAD
jgi:GxxExxY protein